MSYYYGQTCGKTFEREEFVDVAQLYFACYVPQNHKYICVEMLYMYDICYVKSFEYHLQNWNEACNVHAINRLYQKT